MSVYKTISYEEIKSDIESVYRWFFNNVCAKCNKNCQHTGREILLCSKFQDLIDCFADKNRVLRGEKNVFKKD